MAHKYVVNGESFDVRCDAQECSYQLSRSFYVKLEDFGVAIKKFDDLSYGVYDRKLKRWLFVAKAERLEI